MKLPRASSRSSGYAEVMNRSLIEVPIPRCAMARTSRAQAVGVILGGSLERAPSEPDSARHDHEEFRAHEDQSMADGRCDHVASGHSESDRDQQDRFTHSDAGGKWYGQEPDRPGEAKGRRAGHDGGPTRKRGEQQAEGQAIGDQGAEGPAKGRDDGTLRWHEVVGERPARETSHDVKG